MTVRQVLQREEVHFEHRFVHLKKKTCFNVFCYKILYVIVKKTRKTNKRTTHLRSHLAARALQRRARGAGVRSKMRRRKEEAEAAIVIQCKERERRATAYTWSLRRAKQVMWSVNLWNNLSLLFSYYFKLKTNHYFFHKLTLKPLPTLGRCGGRNRDGAGRRGRRRAFRPLSEEELHGQG